MISTGVQLHVTGVLNVVHHCLWMSRRHAHTIFKDALTEFRALSTAKLAEQHMRAAANSFCTDRSRNGYFISYRDTMVHWYLGRGSSGVLAYASSSSDDACCTALSTNS